MRTRTSRLEPRCALFAAAMIATGCGEGPGAPGSDKALTDALGISAAVEPVGLVAGDSFSVLISLTNPRQLPVPFVSPRNCLVEKTTVYQTMAYATDPASAPPVPLVGSGDAGCAYHPTLFVFQTDEPVVITVPMVAWRDDDSARAGLADREPQPVAHTIRVQLTLPSRTAEARLHLWFSGYHEGFGSCTDSAATGPDTAHVFIQPRIVRTGPQTRVQYELHNPSSTPLHFYVCQPLIMAAVDKWTGTEWILGEFPTLCPEQWSGGYPLPVGGCVRGVKYFAWDAAGTYRLRVRVTTETGLLVSDSFVVPPPVP